MKKKFVNSITGKGGLLLILLLVTLLPFFILSFCSHPVSDDFAVANIVMQKGFFGAQKYFYSNWTGRYFADILICLGPLEFNSYWGYKLGAIFLLLVLVYAAYWLSGKLFHNADKSVRIGITSLFLFAYIMRMPDVPSGIFWKASSYAYLTAGFMTFFLLGCLINYFHSINKKWSFILACFFAISVIGDYELNLIYIDLVVLLVAVISILKKRPLFFPLFLLAVCIIFSLISIKAPGNNIRGATYPHANELIFSIKESIIHSGKLLIHWLPFMFFIGLLLLDLLSDKTLWSEESDTIFIIPPWFSFIACLAIPVIGLFVCYWAEGEFPPLRTIDVSYFYFVAGMMYFSFSCIARIKKRYPDFSFPVYVKLPLYLILIFILVFRTNNINVAYRDITSGTASAYNRERTERQNFLTTFKGDSCMIDSIKNIPNSLFFAELPRDRSSWINTSFYQYYHKKYIGIKGR